MSFGGLHIARSGVAASQRALDAIGHNIANVGTPGHSRVRAEQASIERSGPSLLIGPGATGAGVTVTGITRVRDIVLDATVRSELSNSANASSMAETLSRIERSLGPVDGGIASALSAFWNGWEELSLDPTSQASRANLLQLSTGVTSMIKRAAEGVARVGVDNRKAAEVDLEGTNELLENVAGLNQRIREQIAVGEAPNALLDQRDVYVDEIAKSIGATAHLLDNGTLNLSLGGVPLVTWDRTTPLTITGDPATVEVDGTPVSVGGMIGAQLIESQAAVNQVLDDLNALVSSLSDTVNTAHTSGFDLAGDPGGTIFVGNSAFEFALDASFTTESFAAAERPGAADGNHALDMAALRNFDSGTGTVGEQAQKLLAKTGRAVVSANNRAEIDGGILAELEAARSSISGVNLDEELTMLLQFQRAYEASARVLTSVDEMLDVLINRTGLVGR